MAIVFPANFPPQNRPIIGKDLLDFQQYAQLDLGTIQRIFGIPSQQAWYRITRKQVNEPVSDSCVATLLRLYVANPSLIPLEELDLGEAARELGMTTMDLAVLVGRNPLSGREWDKGKPALGTVFRAVSAILKAHEKNPASLDDVWKITDMECGLRGRPLASSRRTKEGSRRRVRRAPEVVAVDNSIVSEID